LYSARGDANNQDWARIEQTDTVPTNGDTCLSFWFAAVMEDHHYETGQSNDTYIEADVIVGGTTVAALVYNWANNITLVVYDGLNGTGGAPCAITPTTQNRWGYLPWTNFIINLCQFAGQQVTLRFTDYDCGQGGHYGWGYVDDVQWLSCPPPAVTLTKVNSPSGAVSQGTTITYTMTYTNAGAGGAENVAVTDNVPANSTLVRNSISSSPPVSSNQSGNTITWAIGELGPGASGTLSFQVVASQSCVTIVNQATETDLLKSCGNPGTLSNPVTNMVGGCTPSVSPTFTRTSTMTATATRSPTPAATATSTAFPCPPTDFYDGLSPATSLSAGYTWVSPASTS
ncbi:MAG: hypothetical protein ACREKE_01770, partial [bacterium]